MLDDTARPAVRERMRRMRAAVHRTVLIVDIEEYGQEWRTTPHRL
jgi:hypothetical protein